MANNGKIIALHNNDVVFLAWQFDQPIPECLGFSVRRKDLGDSGGRFLPLPAWVGWQGGSNENWKPQTTDVWPVQKFSWEDFTATPGRTYEYQVVPMVGTKDRLKPLDELTLISPEVALTPETDNDIAAYFNNGILATQHLAHVLPPWKSGAPDYKDLLNQIGTPQNKLRQDLAGQMIGALKSLLLEAQSDRGQCYCALYELNDPELIQTIIDSKGCIHLILSTAGKDDSTNEEARQRLHDEGVDVTDRMLDSAHIGHNKFVVYTDQTGAPQAVLAGSTNWTSTGLCAQSNNSVIIRDPRIAGFYLDYWKRLKRDTQDADGIASELQSEDFRQTNETANVDGNSTIWFSPNTKAKSKPKGATLESGTPPDLSQVFELIRGAQQAILFLEFQPGSPSVLDVIKEAEEANPSLFIHGAATDAKAIQKFDEKNPSTTALYHRTAAGQPDIVNETGVAATAINDQFAYWKKELLKAGPGAHAIIHDKIVVIDPLSKNDCVVITGSHNQGYKASYANDENLLILRGNQPLALAYTTHVMDVYSHYRWRYMVEQQKDKAWTGLQTTPSWQDKYFETGNMARQELDFWMSAPPVTQGSPVAKAVAIVHRGRTRRTGT
jgi:phosphatidylserine/phosphatidylglycerophosphate/cardiolipin synthase-like enzyme